MAAKLDDLPIAELQAEIRRRQKGVSSLQKRRDKLAAQLAELDAQLMALGTNPDGMHGIMGVPGRRRPRNDSSLADALVDLLKDQTLSVTEAAIEVQKAGYRTTSPNFRTIVNQTLLREDRIKRVGRGLYTSASGAKSASGGTSKKTTRSKKRRTKRSR